MMMISTGVFRRFSIYAIFSVIYSIVPFFCLPVLTRMLPTAEYGKIALFNTALLFAGAIVRMEQQSVLKHMYIGREIAEFPFVVSTALINLVVGTVLLGVLLWVGRFVFPSFYEMFGGWFPLLALIGGAMSVSLFAESLLQISEHAFFCSLWRTGMVLFVYLLMIGFLFFGADWTVRPKALMFAYITVFPLAVWVVKRVGGVGGRYSRKHSVDLIRLGVPLIFSAMGGYVLLGIDRFFLVKMAGLEVTGLYHAAGQFSLCISVIYIAFSSTWEGEVYKTLAGRGRGVRQLLCWFLIFLFVSVCVTVLIVLSRAWLIPLVLGDVFSEAQTYLGWILLAMLFRAIFFLLHPFVLHTGKNFVIMNVMLLVAGCNMVMNYFFIRMFGGVGAAVATALSYCLGFSILLLWVCKNNVISIRQ